jgi:hypothetical protein
VAIQYCLIAELAAFGAVQQRLVGDAAPEEERQA